MNQLPQQGLSCHKDYITWLDGKCTGPVPCIPFKEAWPKVEDLGVNVAVQELVHRANIFYEDAREYQHGGEEDMAIMRLDDAKCFLQIAHHTVKGEYDEARYIAVRLDTEPRDAVPGSFLWLLEREGFPFWGENKLITR